MTAQDIDGKAIAATIREELTNKLSTLPSSITTRPGLAVMLVGSRKDSQTYVRMKQKACADCGMESVLAEYPDGENVKEETLLEKIREWNADEKVNGILVQLPLPTHISEEKILREVDPEKVSDLLDILLL
jgi:5,10-methylene-tetrahydrofolate dehydrogenase/methenyl tetrahydrofolate cyclohydrolase